MTALRQEVAFKRIDIKRRAKGEVMSPRPTTGDHKKIVRAATVETVIRNGELLSELAKI
ncbi:MAG: hypothetical protein MI745_17120 [Pseudomonadales bacterium]|jgi:hypothetical protein|nr:hypothetical protein [Pseudomonadales bacterium]